MKIIARLMRYLLNYWMEIKSALKIQNKICKENSWQTIFHIYWTFFWKDLIYLILLFFRLFIKHIIEKIRMLQLIRGLIEQHSLNKEYFFVKKKNPKTWRQMSIPSVRKLQSQCFLHWSSMYLGTSEHIQHAHNSPTSVLKTCNRCTNIW